MSLLFLFKTSRARSPETPEDYCKLSSGDVFHGEVGERREGGYEGPPWPCCTPLQKQEKVSYGAFRSFEDTSLHAIRTFFTDSDISLAP